MRASLLAGSNVVIRIVDSNIRLPARRVSRQLGPGPDGPDDTPSIFSIVGIQARAWSRSAMTEKTRSGLALIVLSRMSGAMERRERARNDKPCPCRGARAEPRVRFGGQSTKAPRCELQETYPASPPSVRTNVRRRESRQGRG